MREFKLHCAVAEYLDLILGRGVWWTTFPAGGGGKARGGRLKSMGLKAGVPDILIIHDGRPLWIELKTPKGRISDVQILTHGDIVNAGGEVVVCRSVEQVEDALRDWSVPLRKVLTLNMKGAKCSAKP